MKKQKTVYASILLWYLAQQSLFKHKATLHCLQPRDVSGARPFFILLTDLSKSELFFILLTGLSRSESKLKSIFE